MDFAPRTQKILKEMFGDTNGPITTSGQKLLIAQHLPDQLVKLLNEELCNMYNTGWTDAMSFFSNFSSRVDEVFEAADAKK